MRFYLGTHRPWWLGLTAAPLMVSDRTLASRRSLPRARGPWVLDSGGFSELSLRGTWEVPAADYAARVRRYAREVGWLQWAAIQDWMCEPFILAKTRLTVAEHQARTIESYLQLREIAPDLPWLPVLQGWGADDYRRHLEMYARAGVELLGLPVVGLGSVCRRQGTAEVEALIRELHDAGLSLHGFGFKVQGLARVAAYLSSADSLAWSFDARRTTALPECGGNHRSCSNCIRYALWWRAHVLAQLGGRGQMPLFARGAAA